MGHTLPDDNDVISLVANHRTWGESPCRWHAHTADPQRGCNPIRSETLQTRPSTSSIVPGAIKSVSVMRRWNSRSRHSARPNPPRLRTRR